MRPYGGRLNTIMCRLLTDQRMKNVWPALRRAKVTSEAISDVLPGLARPPGLQVANLESIERLKTWDIPDRDVSLQDQACAALFAFTVIEFDFPRPIGTQDAADALAAPLFSAAKTCRWIANEAPSPSPKEKSALETAAAYIENWAAWQLKHLLDNPYVIGKRSSGDDKIRARVRALATATHRIFGSFLYGTVATVATVALQPETTLTPRTVRNWCADLARPSKTPA
jgi:hypothetical protein